MGHDELAEYLESLKREECYRVDEVIKESPFETTQRVSFIGMNGARRGPYIRKYIKRDAGLGSVYERIHEAQSGGRRFKHIPAILECYQRDDDFVVVMEYVRGETLQEHVSRYGASVGFAQTTFPLLCDGVGELHNDFDPPIIHRDLKPSNIVLNDRGLTIIDFGIAREYRDGAPADTARFGTREFAPPEQFGFGQTTIQSDVYALGMLLLFCLTGALLNPAEREQQLSNCGVPGPLQSVIMRATAFDPANRFANVSDLKAAFLEALRADETTASVAAPEASTPTPARNPSSTQTASSTTAMEAPRKSRWQLAGKIYNGVIVVFTAIVCATSFYDIWFPPKSQADYPFAYNVVSYGIVVPCFMVGLCLACMDKRRLRQKFPRLGNVKGWQVWVAFVILVIALALLIAGAGKATGIS